MPKMRKGFASLLGRVWACICSLEANKAVQEMMVAGNDRQGVTGRSGERGEETQ